ATRNCSTAMPPAAASIFQKRTRSPPPRKWRAAADGLASSRAIPDTRAEVVGGGRCRGIRRDRGFDLRDRGHGALLAGGSDTGGAHFAIAASAAGLCFLLAGAH